MKLSTSFGIALKRTLRNPLFLAMLAFLCFCVLFFGSIEKEVQSAPVGVTRRDDDPAAVQMMENMEADGFVVFPDEESLCRAIRQEEIGIGIALKEGLTERMENGRSEGVMVLYCMPTASFVKVTSLRVSAHFAQIYAPYIVQELMEQIDGVHVVCGIDLGDPDNIHPTDKYPFGARAAGLALEKVYGLGPVEGKPYGLSPAITKVERTEEGLLLTLSNAQSLTGPEEIEGFMFMANRLWHETTATLRGNQILIKCDKENVTYFNYLQDTSFPGMEFVYNEYGLPVAPLTYTAVPQ